MFGTMIKIVLTRIDDRLIHGQITACWVKHTQAQKIIIVDDEVSRDPFLSKVIKKAAPSDIETLIYSTEDAIKVLKDNFTENETDCDKTILLLKNLRTLQSLIINGVKLKEVNIGGISAGPGRRLLSKNIFVSAEEREVLKNLVREGVYVYLQVLPSDPAIALSF